MNALAEFYLRGRADGLERGRTQGTASTMTGLGIGAGVGALGGKLLPGGSGAATGAIRGAGTAGGAILGGQLGRMVGSGLLGQDSGSAANNITGIAGNLAGALLGYKALRAMTKTDEEKYREATEEAKEKSSAYTIHRFDAQVKEASSMDEARELMGRIYQENPSYWPYGLSTTSWNGGLWLIRDAGTQKAAGFVGWQEFNEGGKRVGYYGIGMLPEFRKKGYAAEAVAKIIQEKRASVDAVRAFIMPHNGPSHALARTLGVEVVHEG